MTITNDLQEMFTDTCQWFSLQSRDSYGNPQYTTGHEYPCRLVRKNKLVRKSDAQEVVSSAHCWIGPSLVSGEPFPNVLPDDRVTLSDGKSPQIASVEIFQDDLGPSHAVVYFL